MAQQADFLTEGYWEFPMGSNISGSAMVSPFLGDKGLGLYQYAEIKDKANVILGGTADILVSAVNNSYVVNATIYDLEYNVVVEILNNYWRINTNAVSKYNYDNKGLEVFDNTGRIVFNIDFILNSTINMLYIQAFTRYPDGYAGFFPGTNYYDHLKLVDPSDMALRQFYNKTPMKQLFRYFGNGWQNSRQ